MRAILDLGWRCCLKRITYIFNFGDRFPVKWPTIAALVIAACLGNCVRTYAGNSRSFGDPEPLLSYVTESYGHYQWVFWGASSHQKEVFLELPKAPEFVFWDTQEMRVYYAVESRIFSAAYPQRLAAPSNIAALPPGDVRLMWVELASGRLRVVELEEIPDNAITKGIDATLTYRLHDGSSVPGSNFPWGSPGVCTVLELTRNGKWLPVARRATKFEAGETPGLDVVNEFRHERGASQNTLLMSYTYAHGKLGGENLPKELISRLTKAGIHSVSDFTYAPGGNGLAGLVFPAVMGDTLHAETPLFIVSQTGQLRRIKLRSRDDQIGLTRSSRYLLIANEYSGDDPTVIDLKTGTTLISERARSAVWVPSPNPERTAAPADSLR